MRSQLQSVTLSEADILHALRDCYDPEVPLNIVDLGLVYSVAVALDLDAPGAGIPGVPPRHRVAVTITLTSPGCAAEKQIVAQIENRLAAFESVSHTQVEVVWNPLWTPERISPEGRASLGPRLTSKQHTNGLIQIQTPGKDGS